MERIDHSNALCLITIKWGRDLTTDLVKNVTLRGYSINETGFGYLVSPNPDSVNPA